MHATPYFYIICGVSQTKLYNLCKNYAKIKIREKSATAFAAADFPVFSETIKSPFRRNYLPSVPVGPAGAL